MFSLVWGTGALWLCFGEGKKCGYVNSLLTDEGKFKRKHSMLHKGDDKNVPTILMY